MKAFGILLVSTGDLAESMKRATELYLGRVAHLKSLVLLREDHWDDAKDKIEKEIDSLEKGKGVLVLTDVYGGTPFNVSVSLRGEKNVEVMGGVNLPLVMKAVEIASTMGVLESVLYLERYGREHLLRSTSGSEDE